MGIILHASIVGTMVKIWNDCPVCGEELKASSTVYLECPNDHYDVLANPSLEIQDEAYIIQEYSIYRAPQLTDIDRAAALPLLSLNFVIKFQAISSKEKIEKLLLLL